MGCDDSSNGQSTNTASSSFHCYSITVEFNIQLNTCHFTDNLPATNTWLSLLNQTLGWHWQN